MLANGNLTFTSELASGLDFQAVVSKHCLVKTLNVNAVTNEKVAKIISALSVSYLFIICSAAAG